MYNMTVYDSNLPFLDLASNIKPDTNTHASISRGMMVEDNKA